MIMSCGSEIRKRYVKQLRMYGLRLNLHYFIQPHDFIIFILPIVSIVSCVPIFSDTIPPDSGIMDYSKLRLYNFIRFLSVIFCLLLVVFKFV